MSLAPAYAADGILERSCARCLSSSHGARRFQGHPDLSLSVSRSGLWWLVGLSAEGRIGVDVESVTVRALRLATSVLARDLGKSRLISEVAALGTVGEVPSALSLWSAKEAVLKAAGVGLAVRPRFVIVEADDAGQPLARIVGDDRPFRLVSVGGSKDAVGWVSAEAGSIVDVARECCRAFGCGVGAGRPTRGFPRRVEPARPAGTVALRYCNIHQARPLSASAQL